MSHDRTSQIQAFGRLLMAAILIGIPFATTAAPPQLSTASATTTTFRGPEIDVRFIDGSTLKVRLLDESIDLNTKYGPLKIKSSDIRRVDFASRIPPEIAEKIGQAIVALGNPEHNVRLQAVADLKAFGPRAYSAIQKATQHEDPEIAQKAEDLLDFFKLRYTEDQLQIRDRDIVQTDDSRITGQLNTTSLRIGTFQFGELKLKLADARSLGDGPDEDDLLAANAQPAPASLMTYANQFNKVLVFKVTTNPPNFGGLNPGGLWGSDQYTLDSSLALAAIHAGILKPGETGVVRVKIIPSPQIFTGSIRNGVQSQAFGVFPGGAFEFVKSKKK